jgi:hypothetical protein
MTGSAQNIIFLDIHKINNKNKVVCKCKLKNILIIGELWDIASAKELRVREGRKEQEEFGKKDN